MEKTGKYKQQKRQIGNLRLSDAQLEQDAEVPTHNIPGHLTR